MNIETRRRDGRCFGFKEFYLFCLEFIKMNIYLYENILIRVFLRVQLDVQIFDIYFNYIRKRLIRKIMRVEICWGFHHSENNRERNVRSECNRLYIYIYMCSTGRVGKSKNFPFNVNISMTFGSGCGRASILFVIVAL